MVNTKLKLKLVKVSVRLTFEMLDSEGETYLGEGYLGWMRGTSGRVSGWRTTARTLAAVSEADWFL